MSRVETRSNLLNNSRYNSSKATQTRFNESRTLDLSLHVSIIRSGHLGTDESTKSEDNLVTRVMQSLCQYFLPEFVKFKLQELHTRQRRWTDPLFTRPRSRWGSDLESLGPEFLGPKAFETGLAPFLSQFRRTRCCTVLLKCYSIWSCLGNDPEINFMIEHFHINVLVYFDTFFNKNERRFQAEIDDTSPDH